MERAAFAFDTFAFHPQSPAVHRYELPRKRQTKSRPLLLPRVRRIYLLEFPKNPFVVLRLDANPGVAHRYMQTLHRLACESFIRCFRNHTDPASLPSELDGIAQQVV